MGCSAVVPVDLRHFRSFVVVAEEGHIGRAAKRLFITQPALSRQMQQLEREIGAPILVRTPRGVELTDAGSELLVASARGAARRRRTRSRSGGSSSRAARWRSGCRWPAVRERWFGLVQAYAERYPAVEVRAARGDDRAAAGPAAGRRARRRDRVRARAASPGLTYTHVHDETLSVCAARRASARRPRRSSSSPTSRAYA